MRAQFCHPKTTPNMPIREALRMTMAIPGLYTAWFYDHLGLTDTYVDGCCLCNYPIHCFDGWYLSMDKEDTFLKRFQPLDEINKIRTTQFIPYNDKTFGCLLYDDSEEDIMRFNLDHRIGSNVPSMPSRDTKLYLNKLKRKDKVKEAASEHKKHVNAVEALMAVINKHSNKNLDYIDRCDMRAALADEEVFPREQSEILFGSDAQNPDKIFDLLDLNKNGRVSIREFLMFAQRKGVKLHDRTVGYGRREINSFSQFLKALGESLLTNLKYVYATNKDENRTIGINTGHVQTTDQVLELEDKEFLMLRGYNATKSFMKYFAILNPDKVIKKSSEAKQGQPNMTDDYTDKPIPRFEIDTTSPKSLSGRESRYDNVITKDVIRKVQTQNPDTGQQTGTTSPGVQRLAGQDTSSLPRIISVYDNAGNELVPQDKTSGDHTVEDYVTNDGIRIVRFKSSDSPKSENSKQLWKKSLYDNAGQQGELSDIAEISEYCSSEELCNVGSEDNNKSESDYVFLNKKRSIYENYLKD